MIQNAKKILHFLASIALIPLGCLGLLIVLSALYLLQFGLIILPVVGLLIFLVVVIKEKIYDGRKKQRD